MSKDIKVGIQRALTVIIWILAFYLLITRGSWYLLALILGLHLLEVPTKGYKMGVSAGYSGGYSILMTLIFGFTWWLYLND